MRLALLLSLIIAGCIFRSVCAQPEGIPWKQHTIDAGSQGADGVRVADINADGLLDLTTGWEEGGEVRVYLNPGPGKSKQLWPHAVVGPARSVEDAVFADITGDGRLDIVACCEGKQRSVLAFIANGDDPLQAGSWLAAAFPQVQELQQWMFALPMQIDGLAGVDLVIGSKGTSAGISWLQAPLSPVSKTSSEHLAAWKLHPLTAAGWIMSLRHHDIDGDGDEDIVFSDRRGPLSGCWWLENPGTLPDTALQTAMWKRRPIAGLGKEVMFMDLADFNGDGEKDIVSAVSGGDIVVAQRVVASDGVDWQESVIAMPQGVGTGKAVVVADVNLDGKQDVIVSCENAQRACGVFWLQRTPADTWQARDISGSQAGVKFDRIEMLDLDADGDLDVITCEERDNLGVIWYENPTR